MRTEKRFTVKTSDGLVWQVHTGFIAPDFVQASVIKSKDISDIGAGFSCSITAITGELAEKIKANM